jgi:5-methylcytosine-specific restriction endonuclease McrA
MTGPEWAAMRSTTVCHWCSCKLHPSFTTVEHIQPLSEGGQHTFANVVQACWNCNLQRNWMKQIKHPRKES